VCLYNFDNNILYDVSANLENDVKTPLRSWINYAKGTMEENMKFIIDKCKDVIDVKFGVANDVLDILSWISPQKDLPNEKRLEMFFKYLMYPMILHVAYPNINFLPVAILLGAVSYAFYSLRIALEALVVDLYANCNESLKDLPWRLKLERNSVVNATVFGVKDAIHNIFVSRVGSEEGDEWARFILGLYQQISAWIHPMAKIKEVSTRRNEKVSSEAIAVSILKTVALTFEKWNTPPAYELVIPMNYDEKDLETLGALNIITKYTKATLSVIAYVWSFDKDVSNRDAISKHLNTVAVKLNTVKDETCNQDRAT